MVDQNHNLILLAERWGVPSINLDAIPIDPQAVRLIPRHLSEKYGILILNRQGSVITLCLSELNPAVLDAVRFATSGLTIEPVISTREKISAAIKEAYTRKVTTAPEKLLALHDEIKTRFESDRKDAPVPPCGASITEAQAKAHHYDEQAFQRRSSQLLQSAQLKVNHRLLNQHRGAYEISAPRESADTLIAEALLRMDKR
jgi:hypothetical protein